VTGFGDDGSLSPYTGRGWGPTEGSLTLYACARFSVGISIVAGLYSQISALRAVCEPDARHCGNRKMSAICLTVAEMIRGGVAATPVTH
jgi:hypothetical protein